MSRIAIMVFLCIFYWICFLALFSFLVSCQTPQICRNCWTVIQ